MERDLLDVQANLQAEADQIVAELGLMDLLAPFGRAVRVGSSALGVMVRRDIDITVVCDRLDHTALTRFGALAAELMSKGEQISSVRFRNDSGDWNAAPEAYPDGLYLGVTARASNSADWTFDIWLVDEPDRQPDLKHLETLPPRLSDETRLRILEIKHALAMLPNTESGPSAWVYEAVLDFGVASLAEYEAWRARRKQSA